MQEDGKNTWKRIVALVVMIAMTMSSAVYVYASDVYDESYDSSVELIQSPDTANYFIYVDQTDGGVITVSTDSAEEGQLVTIKMEPEDGKQLSKIILNDGSIEAVLNEDGTYSFDMPACDVTVAAEWDDEEQENLIYTVGDGVTAAIVTEENGKALYFNSDNGTLYNDWKSIIGIDQVISITSIGFMPESGTLYFPENSEYIFFQFKKVLEIDLSKVDTSKSTSMYHMFAGCNDLRKLDLSGFNTENVTNMGYMFQSCSSLTELNVKSFDTKNVTLMVNMFSTCRSLTELDLSGFDMTSVTNAAYMLTNCDAVEVLKTPKNNESEIDLPIVLYDDSGNSYETIPVLSESITLYKAALPEINKQPVSCKKVKGKRVKFSVSASGFGLTYQWQSLKPGNTTWKNSGLLSAKTSTLSFTMYEGYDGIQYRCVVGNVYGESVISDAALISLAVAPVIVSQPESIKAVVGVKANFAVTAEGSGLTYQWQYQKPNRTTWTNSGSRGNKSNTLQVSATTGTNGMKFRCVVTDEDGIVAVSYYATLTAS